jgi:flagellar biosynthetic protein FliR
METTLAEFMNVGVFAFIIAFTRLGAAMTIMPGVGDSFTPMNIRLFIALGLSLCLAPLIMPFIPNPVPGPVMMTTIVAIEFVYGVLIGTIARIFMLSLDTAGMIISMQSGLGSAQLFNPAAQSQGSLIGAFLSMAGVIVLFASNMHHLLFYALIESYSLLPLGQTPDTGSIANLVSQTIAASFRVGLQLAAPFIVVGMMLFIGMGVLSRLMPQIQVFMLAMPVQILLGLMMLAIVVSSFYLFWLSEFEQGMMLFIDQTATLTVPKP